MLSISTTNALISMHTTPSKLEMTSKAASLELQAQPIKLNINTDYGFVEIDQKDAFASAGLKTCSQLSKDFAETGMSQALEYIGKVAQDGGELAAIQNHSNVIANQARRDLLSQNEFGFASIPSVGPQFNVRPAGVTFDPDPVNTPDMKNAIKTNYIHGEQQINFEPSKISFYMQQYNSIKITYQSKVNVTL